MSTDNPQPQPQPQPDLSFLKGIDFKTIALVLMAVYITWQASNGNHPSPPGRDLSEIAATCAYNQISGMADLFDQLASQGVTDKASLIKELNSKSAEITSRSYKPVNERLELDHSPESLRKVAEGMRNVITKDTTVWDKLIP